MAALFSSRFGKIYSSSGMVMFLHHCYPNISDITNGNCGKILVSYKISTSQS